MIKEMSDLVQAGELRVDGEATYRDSLWQACLWVTEISPLSVHRLIPNKRQKRKDAVAVDGNSRIHCINQRPVIRG